MALPAVSGHAVPVQDPRRWGSWWDRRIELLAGAIVAVVLIADFALFGLIGGLVVALVGLVVLACVALALVMLRDSLR
jgi:hypothetical protein